jgi:hypothetical protein
VEAGDDARASEHEREKKPVETKRGELDLELVHGGMLGKKASFARKNEG